MVKQEYTPGLDIMRTPIALDGRLLVLKIQGFGADTPTLLVNTYQWVNSPENQLSAMSLLNHVYSLAKDCLRKNHHMIWTGDLNAVLSPDHRINYANVAALAPGDKLLQDMVMKMGATNILGQNEITWKSKIGDQQSTLDHIFVLPPDLQVVKGGAEFNK